MSNYQAVIDAPFPQPPCLLGIRIVEESVIGIDYIFSTSKRLNPHTSFAKMVVDQLTNYFSNIGHSFDFPIELHGTPFQLQVWQVIAAIPTGETRKYGNVAKQLASSARAVGNACRKNPLPIIIPCHRIVSASGLGGYAGHTTGRNISIKRWLLAHEAQQN